MKLECPKCHKPTGPEMLPGIKGWYDPSFSCRACGYHGKLSWQRIETTKSTHASKKVK